MTICPHCNKIFTGSDRCLCCEDKLRGNTTTAEPIETPKIITHGELEHLKQILETLKRIEEHLLKSTYQWEGKYENNTDNSPAPR